MPSTGQVGELRSKKFFKRKASWDRSVFKTHLVAGFKGSRKQYSVFSQQEVELLRFFILCYFYFFFLGEHYTTFSRPEAQDFQQQRLSVLTFFGANAV